MPALCLARLTGTKLTSICTVPLCLGSLLVQVPLFWGLWAPGGAREHLGLLQLILTELSVVGSFLRLLVLTQPLTLVGKWPLRAHEAELKAAPPPEPAGLAAGSNLAECTPGKPGESGAEEARVWGKRQPRGFGSQPLEA